MSFLKHLLSCSIIIIVALLGLSYFLPREWKVERSIVINTTPEKIYPFIANFNTGWPQWSAFDALFPDLVYTASGPEEGVGATRSWSSPENTGSQSIIKADPTQGIEYIRDCVSGTCIRGQIQLTPYNGTTVVRWADIGSTGNNPIARLKSFLFVNMDQLMGGLFEQSLVNLKKLAEQSK